MANAVDINNLSFEYEEGAKTIDQISFSVPKGSYTVVLGHNGSGKSTIAKLIIGLLEPKTGDITVDGIHLDEEHLYDVREKVGIVFQNPDNQIVAAVVEEDVAFGPENLGIPSAEIRKRVDAALEAVNMTEYREHGPHLLSGGQKQRVAIARALANDPKILISDESTSALDPKTTKQILALLQELNKKLGLTIVLITHEMQIVKDIANRVAVMQNGELIEEGSVLDIFSNPKNALTQDFITVATGIDEAMVKINQQAIVKNLPDDSMLAHLKYAGSVTDTAIINDIYKQYQVSANILFGNIEILDHTPVGELVVILSGENQNLETAKAELENAGVSVTIVKDGRKA